MDREQKIRRVRRWLKNNGLTWDDLSFDSEFRGPEDLPDDLLDELLEEFRQDDQRRHT